MPYPPQAYTSNVAAQDSGRRARLIIVALAVVASAVAVYAVVVHQQLVQLREDSSRIIQAHLETIALRNQQVAALDQLATRIDAFNRQFGARLGKVEVENLESSVEHLKQQGHLPDDAKRTLDEFEKNAAEIDAMTAKVKEFEHYLGAPIIVKRGESHADIARRYLVEQAKLSPDEADKVIKRTALDWQVEPGNEVFNLYHDGILLSTVTQGTARHSPLMVQWSRQRATQKKRQELEARIKELEAQVASLQTRGGTAPPPGTLWIKRSDGTTTDSGQ